MIYILLYLVLKSIVKQTEMICMCITVCVSMMCFILDLKIKLFLGHRKEIKFESWIKEVFIYSKSGSNTVFLLTSAPLQ